LPDLGTFQEIMGEAVLGRLQQTIRSLSRPERHVPCTCDKKMPDGRVVKLKNQADRGENTKGANVGRAENPQRVSARRHSEVERFKTSLLFSTKQ
jgi:hypothetical protein